MASPGAKTDLTAEKFRRTLGCFATGVTVVTVVRPDGGVHGMTANAFSSVSLVPPLVLVCVGHSARTFTLLPQQGRFGINVLRREQEELSRFFATPEQDPQAAARLGVRFQFTERGTALLEGCLAQLECALIAGHEAGDHTIFVGQVESAASSDGEPLLFYRGRFGGLDPDFS